MNDPAHLNTQRQMIRRLLNEQSPADAEASYFAFYHADLRTRLFVYPPTIPQSSGYVAVSQTGMDLFRPYVTLRLPPKDIDGGVSLMYQALQPGTAVILHCPATDYPLIQMLFEIQSEESLQTWVLNPQNLPPFINVLVTQEQTANGLPRFVIRQQGIVVASAGINWQSPHYAEIAVYAHPDYRRQGLGKSVVEVLVREIVCNGRSAIYKVADNNTASIQLAQSLGFQDTHYRSTLIQATLKPKP